MNEANDANKREFFSGSPFHNLAQIGTENFDVLVVVVAFRAPPSRGLQPGGAARGLGGNVVGRGASASSLKIIHGGLRYLQHANLVNARIHPRAAPDHQLAPATVDPSPASCRGAAGAAQSVGAAGRADGLAGDERGPTGARHRRLPAGRLISRRALKRFFRSAFSRRVGGHGLV